jgi:hypothetical protein
MKRESAFDVPGSTGRGGTLSSPQNFLGSVTSTRACRHAPKCGKSARLAL